MLNGTKNITRLIYRDSNFSMEVNTIFLGFLILLFLYAVNKSEISYPFKILIIGTVLVESIYSTLYLLNYYPKRESTLFLEFFSHYTIFLRQKENNGIELHHISNISEIIIKINTTKIGVSFFIFFFIFRITFRR